VYDHDMIEVVTAPIVDAISGVLAAALSPHSVL
jgi:hypothetical protein